MSANQKQLIDYLSGFVTEQRFDQFKNIIQYRTRYITVVIEDVFQSHNASAVLRSCECFGIQDVHFIEKKNKYTLSPDVALGSSKWIDIQRYKSSLGAIQQLREQEYRIVATTPHKDGCSLEDFNLDKGKIALFFGTELEGLTPEVIDNADEYLKIPMFGFTESFNISVSAAIILHHLTLQLRNSDLPWRLDKGEEEVILLNWLRQTIKKCDLIEKEFLSKHR